MKSTTIKISERTWRRLNARKMSPGETFEDAVERVLDELDEEESDA